MDPILLEALRRGSGLRLSADGEFSFTGEPVTHPRVEELFHRGVVVRPDGEVILQVGAQWAYLECETVAHFVKSLDTGGGSLVATLLGGDVLTGDRPRIGMGPDDRFYLWMAGGQVPAVLTRKAHHQLSQSLEDGGDGTAILPLGRESIVVQELPAIPGAGDRWAPEDEP